MIVHQYSTRQRLIEANGHADNHVMSIGGLWGYTEDQPDLGNLFRAMDQWLMAIDANQSDVGGDFIMLVGEGAGDDHHHAVSHTGLDLVVIGRQGTVHGHCTKMLDPVGGRSGRQGGSTGGVDAVPVAGGGVPTVTLQTDPSKPEPKPLGADRGEQA